MMMFIYFHSNRSHNSDNRTLYLFRLIITRISVHKAKQLITTVYKQRDFDRQAENKFSVVRKTTLKSAVFN